MPRYEPPVSQWILECEAQLQGIFAYWRRTSGRQRSLCVGTQNKVYYVPCEVPTSALAARNSGGLVTICDGGKRRGEELDVLNERVRSSSTSHGHWVPDGHVQTLCPARHQNRQLRVGCFRSSGGNRSLSWGDPTRQSGLASPPAAVARRLIEGWLLFHILRRISPFGSGLCREYKYGLGERYLTGEAAADRQAGDRPWLFSRAR